MQLRNMMLAAIFAAFMIISSYIVLPIGPVPHTLQPLVVLLSGVLLGHKWGPISIIVWVVLGVLGLPVFNQGQAGAGWTSYRKKSEGWLCQNFLLSVNRTYCCLHYGVNWF